ncbi:MAG: hypothetical protein NTU80_13330 [Verrucomicrobia bacterium]|nr:hypothetical protein [Verrucomicrobiota bacterium]
MKKPTFLASVVFTSAVAIAWANPVTPAREDPLPDDLRAHQRLDPEPPPSAPANTPADPGRPLPPLPAPASAGKIQVNTLTTPSPAPGFNPDPGSPEPAPSASSPYFSNDPQYPVPNPASSPAPDYPATTTSPRPTTLPDTRTSDPAEMIRRTSEITGAPALPRSGVRATDYIPPDHGHGWKAPGTYPLAEQGRGYPSNSEPAPDRWKDVGFTPWRRYTSGDLNEQPFAHPDTEVWHWYRQSLLKGDAPIHGQDWFLALTASSESLYENRDLPTPSGVSAASPGQFDFFGDYRSTVLVQNIALDVLLFQGETVFTPPRQVVKLRFVGNYNLVEFSAPGIINPNPGNPGGGNNSPLRREDTDFALQEAFYEYHLADLSPTYDFVSLKVGIQPFNSDFRGFIFNDTQLGLRLLGNQDNNRLQYNVAFFDLREKDTNSELNTLDSRQQYVAVANLYRQDFFTKGYTAQLSLHANFDQGGGEYYDTNGGIVRPAPLGTIAPHDVSVGYLGWAGDGHLGRINLNHALYYAFGRDELNGLAGRANEISAALAALEVSYDRDWIRYKASALYATGDSDPTDGRATGFDSIVDNTNFTGGPFSYYVRQGFNLGGTAVAAKQRFSVLPNLRTSKTQGQANFVNPGVVLLGLGTDIEVTPKVRAFVNANHISLARTEAIQTALLTNQVHSDFGLDFSLGLQWRPLLTDNIILSAGYALFLPGRGFDDIYRNTSPGLPGLSRSTAPDDQLHSAVLSLNFTY